MWVLVDTLYLLAWLMGGWARRQPRPFLGCPNLHRVLAKGILLLARAGELVRAPQGVEAFPSLAFPPTPNTCPMENPHHLQSILAGWAGAEAFLSLQPRVPLAHRFISLVCLPAASPLFPASRWTSRQCPPRWTAW